MLVKNRMSSPVITTEPDASIMEVLNLMRSKNIRRMPVVDKQGELIGIVSDKDLLNAGPSNATSLSVWEINYLVGKIKIKDVMTKAVLTVSGDTPIEQAARMMVDNKVGGLPVMDNNQLVGVITESDLFKILLELMGAREPGVRLTALVPDVRGELEKLTRVVANAGGSFIAFGQFNSDEVDHRIVTFKVAGLEANALTELIRPVVSEIIDVRAG
jgi:acetoin utilization protein AcuB